MNATISASHPTISETRRQIEQSGGRVRYYSAWPLIGRGAVRHDLSTHEEIEAVLDSALKPSLFRRIALFLRRI